jgi:hypothetical protein
MCWVSLGGPGYRPCLQVPTRLTGHGLRATVPWLYMDVTPSGGRRRSEREVDSVLGASRATVGRTDAKVTALAQGPLSNRSLASPMRCLPEDVHSGTNIFWTYSFPLRSPPSKERSPLPLRWSRRAKPPPESPTLAPQLLNPTGPSLPMAVPGPDPRVLSGFLQGLSQLVFCSRPRDF